MKIAIIDIGSNSVRLMLWADGKTLYKKISTTRMGAGLHGSGLISEEAMQKTVHAVSLFTREGSAAGAGVYAFATAAVRTASNGDELCRRVFTACGVSVDVVSGETEASLGIAGALGRNDGGIMDIGGASAEVIFQKEGNTTFSVSMPLGAVKLYDICHDRKELLDRVIDEGIKPLERAVPTGILYAVGGTASTLASVKCGAETYGDFLNGTVLEAEFVERTALSLLSMDIPSRRAVKGMEPVRADIIAGGAYFFYKIMQKLGLKSVVFSDRDNLEGYLFLKVLKY